MLSAAFRTEMRFGVAPSRRRARRQRQREGAQLRPSPAVACSASRRRRSSRWCEPVARALIARDALRADAYGGLSLRARRASRSSRARQSVDDRRAAAAQARGAATAAGRTRRSAVRGAARERAARSPPRRACRPTSSSTIRPCARSPPRGPRNLTELAQVNGVGASQARPAMGTPCSPRSRPPADHSGPRKAGLAYRSNRLKCWEEL